MVLKKWLFLIEIARPMFTLSKKEKVPTVPQTHGLPKKVQDKKATAATIKAATKIRVDMAQVAKQAIAQENVIK